MFSLGTDLGQPSRASQLSLGNAREETTPDKAPWLRQIGSERVIRVTKQNLLEQVFNSIRPVLLIIINISNSLKTFLPVTMPVASTDQPSVSMFAIPVFTAVEALVAVSSTFKWFWNEKDVSLLSTDWFHNPQQFQIYLSREWTEELNRTEENVSHTSSK